MRALFLLFLSVAHADRGDAIVSRNIFCSGCKAPCADCVERAPPSFDLYSTLVCPSDGEWSRALIGDRKSGELRFVGPGAHLGDLRLVEIGTRHVTLAAGEKSWRLTLEAERKPAPEPPRNRCESGRCTLQRADVERMVAHPELLGARALPSRDGFLLSLRPDSPLRALGLQNGDRLRAIDGTPLDGMDALIHLWPKLRRASRFQISLVREGRPLSYEVAVE